MKVKREGQDKSKGLRNRVGGGKKTQQLAEVNQERHRHECIWVRAQLSHLFHSLRIWSRLPSSGAI